MPLWRTCAVPHGRFQRLTLATGLPSLGIDRDLPDLSWIDDDGSRDDWHCIDRVLLCNSARKPSWSPNPGDWDKCKPPAWGRRGEAELSPHPTISAQAEGVTPKAHIREPNVTRLCIKPLPDRHKFADAMPRLSFKQSALILPIYAVHSDVTLLDDAQHLFRLHVHLECRRPEQSMDVVVPVSSMGASSQAARQVWAKSWPVSVND